MAVEGTPLEENNSPSIFDMGRMIATARVVMPKTMVRLSAGRLSFSAGEQALMFFAGANSIFNGDKLLTTPNPEFDADTVRVGGWALAALLCFSISRRGGSHQPRSPPIPSPPIPSHQALFEAVGLKGKPAHKAPQETPYPVERLFEEPQQGGSGSGSAVVVTHTKGQQQQAAAALM